MTDEQRSKIATEVQVVIPVLLQMDLAGLLQDLSERHSRDPLYAQPTDRAMLEKSITALYQCQQVLRDQFKSGVETR